MLRRLRSGSSLRLRAILLALVFGLVIFVRNTYSPNSNESYSKPLQEVADVEEGVAEDVPVVSGLDDNGAVEQG